MSIRFYLAPQQGTGTFQDPFRSILNDLIDVQAGDSFQEIDNPARRISICCVRASDATHAVISADARLLPVSARVADDGLLEHLETLFNSLPGIGALKTALEARGISTSWISGSNNVRDGLRYLMRVFSIAQIADGMGNAHVKTIIAQNLDSTVGDVAPAVRNGVKNWMQAKGLATGWITNSTTVRQVIHFIVENLGIGRLRMSGQEF